MPRSTSEATKSPDQQDWGREIELAVAGDRQAYGRLVRLVTGHLVHWRAYDFRADWDDIVQEVILSVVQAHSVGKLNAPGAVQAYARQATRFKFIDRIRATRRQAPGADLKAAERQAEASWPPTQSVSAAVIELRISIQQALADLPERERLAVMEVHVRGRTYEEAAQATRIPLGTLKRALRSGLAALRERLEPDWRP